MSSNNNVNCWQHRTKDARICFMTTRHFQLCCPRRSKPARCWKRRWEPSTPKSKATNSKMRRYKYKYKLWRTRIWNSCSKFKKSLSIGRRDLMKSIFIKSSLKKRKRKFSNCSSLWLKAKNKCKTNRPNSKNKCKIYRRTKCSWTNCWWRLIC